MSLHLIISTPWKTCSTEGAAKRQDVTRTIVGHIAVPLIYQVAAGVTPHKQLRIVEAMFHARPTKSAMHAGIAVDVAASYKQRSEWNWWHHENSIQNVISFRNSFQYTYISIKSFFGIWMKKKSFLYWPLVWLCYYFWPTLVIFIISIFKFWRDFFRNLQLLENYHQKYRKMPLHSGNCSI